MKIIESKKDFINIILSKQETYLIFQSLEETSDHMSENDVINIMNSTKQKLDMLKNDIGKAYQVMKEHE
jgi:hypothetical protein